MKILLGGLNQEINSFSPGKTTLAEYKRKQFLLGEDLIKVASAHVRAYSDLFDAVGGGVAEIEKGAHACISFVLCNYIPFY